MNRISLPSGLLPALMLAASTLFIVDQRRGGGLRMARQGSATEPGLKKVKLPPPFQNVVFRPRIQTLDSRNVRPIFTAEKKSLVIDWLVKWRVAEPRQFIRKQRHPTSATRDRPVPVVHAAAFNEEVTRAPSAACSPPRRQGHGDVRAPGR